MPVLSRIERVGSRSFVLGGEWSVVGQAKQIHSIARDDARNANAGLLCLRKQELQYGYFGIENPPFASRLYSAAAALAEANPQGTLAAFQFKDYTWICTTAGKTIAVENGDRLLFDAAEARALFDDLLATGSYRSVFAPDSWNIPNARPSSISSAFGRQTGPALSRTKADRKTLLAGAAILAVIASVAFFGPDAYRAAERKWFRSKPKPTALIPTLSKPEAPKPVAPRLVPAAYTLAYCAMRTKPNYPTPPAPGFTLTYIECNSDGVSFTFAANSTASIGAAQYSNSKAVANYQSRTILLRETPNIEIPASEIWALHTRDDFEKNLLAIAEAYGGSANIGIAPTLPGSADLLPWQTIPFSFTSQNPVERYGHLLSSFPGLVIRSITYRANQRTAWTIQGEANVYP